LIESAPAFEPYRIKAVEPLGFTTRGEREAVLREAGWNLFRVPADKVLIDLLTDSGTSAMSAEMWAALMRGDESYAGARSFYALERAVRSLTGLRHVLPTHQGRAAERLLYKAAGGAGKVSLSNSHFDSTRAAAAAFGVEAVDLPVPENLDPSLSAPFKGDVDLRALEAKARELGPRAALIVMTLTNNSAGGQPASLSNLRSAREISRHYKIPLFIDASRIAENAWFVKTREAGHAGRPPVEVAREMFSYCDGAWMSAKKDAFVSIGGFLALNDDSWAARAKEEMIGTEGFPTYGGLAGRDLEALAVGLLEGLDERWLSYRIASVERFAELLRRGGVPIVEPPGGHAVFVDAARLLPHLTPSSRPAQALAAQIYLEGGVRASAFSSPGREWVRLTVPRRAYTESHLAHAAAVVAAVAKRAGSIRGLRAFDVPAGAARLLATLEPEAAA
jgi:tryptophanase